MVLQQYKDRLADTKNFDVIGDKKELFKFNYDTLEEAKLVWRHLNNADKQDRLKGYTEVALLLDNKFDIRA